MFNACFSPWAGDPGFITINFGEYEPEEYRNAARSAVTPEEVPYLTHIITLYGNGTPVTARLQGAGTISITALPGDWYIRVRAEHSELGQTLRALGFGQVRVVAGRQANAVIDMISATEVTNHAELAAAIGSARNDGLEKIIVVMQDMYVTNQLTIAADRNITLASDSDVAIRRGVGFATNAAIFVVQGDETLTVGRAEFSGRVYVQGMIAPTPPTYTQGLRIDGDILRGRGTQ
jgi:hypothetical protein